MLDKDGFERPEKTDGNILEIKNEKRKVQFDEHYPFRPRNIFFRIWAAIFRAAAIMVFNPYMAIKYRMVSFGNKNRNKLRHKPFVITCNHVHLFDDLTIGTNLFCWRKIYFTTLDNNIRRPMIGFFLRSLGGIPIPAESISGMRKFNEDVSELLRRKKPVLYNPEAALWPYYREIRPYKRGAFQMAVKNNVPVLPIVALFKRKQKRNGKFKYSIFFAICQPVYPDMTLADERARSEKLMQTVHQTSKRVADEWYKIQDCGFDEQKGLPKLRAIFDLDFVDDKWVVKK